MYPYQLSKVLADQHIHDMVTAAERHNMAIAARRQHLKLAEQPPRLKALIAQIRARTALIFGRRSTPARSTTNTLMSDAGPMGCSA